MNFKSAPLVVLMLSVAALCSFTSSARADSFTMTSEFNAVLNALSDPRVGLELVQRVDDFEKLATCYSHARVKVAIGELAGITSFKPNENLLYARSILFGIRIATDKGLNKRLEEEAIKAIKSVEDTMPSGRLTQDDYYNVFKKIEEPWDSNNPTRRCQRFIDSILMSSASAPSASSTPDEPSGTKDVNYGGLLEVAGNISGMATSCDQNDALFNKAYEACKHLRADFVNYSPYVATLICQSSVQGYRDQTEKTGILMLQGSQGRFTCEQWEDNRQQLSKSFEEAIKSIQ